MHVFFVFSFLFVCAVGSSTFGFEGKGRTKFPELAPALDTALCSVAHSHPACIDQLQHAVSNAGQWMGDQVHSWGFLLTWKALGIRPFFLIL